MSALHPRPPAKTPKKKSVFPPFPEPNMATLPAPAVIDPLPDETKANNNFLLQPYPSDTLWNAVSANKRTPVSQPR
jgi:hypothetical protein